MPLVRLSEDDEPAPNLAPMIDVILVLTIFFMCATKFSGDERTFDLDLPKVGAADPVGGGRPEVIEVTASGGVRLAGATLTIGGLGARLAEMRSSRPELAVLVRGDRAVTHGVMAEVYEACRTAGVRSVAIAVQTGADSRRR